MVPDCIEYLRYVQKDGLYLMSEIKGLHTLLAGQKQGGVRVEWLGMNLNWRSDIRSLEKMKDLMSSVVMDSMTLLIFVSKLIGLQLRGLDFTPCLCNAVMLADFEVDGICPRTNDWVKKGKERKCKSSRSGYWTTWADAVRSSCRISRGLPDTSPSLEAFGLLMSRTGCGAIWSDRRDREKAWF